MSRIQTNYLLMNYFSSEIQREDIMKKLDDLEVDEYMICKNLEGTYQCLLFKEIRFNASSWGKYKVKGIEPTAQAVKVKNAKDIKDKYPIIDPKFISKGKNMPTSVTIEEGLLKEEGGKLNKAEKEYIKNTRSEIKRLKNELKKRNKPFKGNITINAIVNFHDNLNIKVNNLGEETLDHLTADDIKEILCQPNAERLAMRCLEKVHFNPNSRENNNVVMTNAKDDRLFVRKDDQWKSEKDYLGTVNEMTRNIPRHINSILQTPTVELPDREMNRVLSVINTEIPYPETHCRIRDKIPEAAYAFTKLMTKAIEDSMEFVEEEEDSDEDEVWKGLELKTRE